MLANESRVRYIREVDICKYDPWELPRLSNDESGDQEWFFFCAQDFKYSNGLRSNRATASGYWKSTGKNGKITERGKKSLVIGSKKTLVFYKGRVPNGVRTNWVIHEYLPKFGFAVAKSFVICRLKKKVADENENAALTCDEAGFVNSNFENVPPIQEPSDYELYSPLYSDQEPTYSDFLAFDDFGSQVSDLQHSDYELYSPLHSNQEPTHSDFQASDDFGSEVSDLPLQSAPEPAEEDLDVNDFIDSILVDDRNEFNAEELLSLVNQNHGGGFSTTTGTDVAFGRQNDDVSQSLFGEHTSSRIQSTPTIKESRRSILTSKILRSQRQRRSKSNKLVAHVDAPKIVRSKSVAQCEAISHHKEKADAKHKVVRLPKPSMEDQKNEVSKCCRGESVKSGRKGSSMILTTKCIHHQSNPPSVYVDTACIGFILFVIIVREVLLYGNWW